MQVKTRKMRMMNLSWMKMLMTTKNIHETVVTKSHKMRMQPGIFMPGRYFSSNIKRNDLHRNCEIHDEQGYSGN